LKINIKRQEYVLKGAYFSLFFVQIKLLPSLDTTNFHLIRNEAKMYKESFVECESHDNDSIELVGDRGPAHQETIG